MGNVLKGSAGQAKRRATMMLLLLFLATLGFPAAANNADHNHFLFFRENTEGPRLGTTTLLLASVMPQEIVVMEIITHPELDRFGIMHVAHGTIYGRSARSGIVAIDIAEGTGHVLSPLRPDYRTWSGSAFLWDDKLYDFSREAYRHIISPARMAERSPVVFSPDGQQLAYFVQPAESPLGNRFLLQRVDRATAATTEVGEPLQHNDPAMSSILGYPPSMLWLDADTLLLVVSPESSTPDEHGHAYYPADWAPWQLARMDAKTGAREILLDVPGGLSTSLPYLFHNPSGPVLRHGRDYYLVDIEQPALHPVKDQASLGMWPNRYDPSLELIHDGLLLDIAVENARPAPGGEQVVWTVRPTPPAEITDVFRERRQERTRLRLYDTRLGTIRTVAEGHLRLPRDKSVCWLRDEDLVYQEVPPEEGWTPFEREPWTP